MQKVLGYMLTWTAYGSWLQGDKRKYVKNGKILGPNPSLENKNSKNLKYPKVSLTTAQREIIERAISGESFCLGQKIHSISAGRSHIHLVTDCNFISAASAASHYKNAARLAMKSNGFVGRLWTRGFSVRYCFDEKQLSAVVEYVNRHNRNHQSASPQVYPGG